MPRINVEDSVYRDARFINLILKTGNQFHALGALVAAWSLAQKYWLNKETGGLIPLEEWKNQKMDDQLFDVGLCKTLGSYVYVCGSKEQFAWLTQRSDAGKKGGQSKNPKKMVGLKQFQSSVTDRNETVTESDGPYPLTHTLTHTLRNNTLARNDKIVPSRRIELKENEFDGIDDEKIKVWKLAYPAIDIQNEIRKALAWALANPKNKKKNWERFLVNWFSRSQERARPENKQKSNWASGPFKA